MSTPDPFGDQLDADTIEKALRASVQAWLPDHLAHQERRKHWPARTLPPPRSWPTVSEWDVAPQKVRPPAVVILSQGTTGANERLPNGSLRRHWRFEIAVIVAGRTEDQAREVASAYLMAVAGAAQQVPSLGGVVENTRWTGPDDYAYGELPDRSGQRAVYGTAFEITARTTAPAVAQTAPSQDPYDVGPAPELPDTVVIDVTATAGDA